jgi:hypothetical protein
VRVIRDAGAGGGSEIAGPTGGDERGTSSQRIVRGPRRPIRVLAAGAIVGLAVGAVALVWPDGRTRPAPGEVGEKGDRGSAADAGDGLAESAPTVFAEAAQRFGRASTFTYTGTVYAAGPSLLRPGPWLADKLVVHGAVLLPRPPTSLPRALTWEVAADRSDALAVAETVTLGPEVWGRTAVRQPRPTRVGTSPEALSTRLAGVQWAVVPAATSGIDRLGATVPARLGLAWLPDALASASAARDQAPDPSGRRVIWATIPERAAEPTDVRSVEALLTGAELVVTLDRSGGVTRVVLTVAPAGDPTLIIDVEILQPADPDVETPDPSRLSDLARCDWTDLLGEDLVADATSPLNLAAGQCIDR